MYLGLITGSTESYSIMLGSTLFVMAYRWEMNNKFYPIAEEISKDPTGICRPLHLECIAFKRENDDWISVQNVEGMDNFGRALNAINRDKKVRLAPITFKNLYKDAYKEALEEELLNI